MFSCQSLCELDKKDMSPSYREYSENVKPARGSCPEMLKELEILVTDRQRVGGHKSKVKQTTCPRGAGIHRMRPRLSACKEAERMHAQEAGRRHYAGAV